MSGVRRLYRYDQNKHLQKHEVIYITALSRVESNEFGVMYKAIYGEYHSVYGYATRQEALNEEIKSTEERIAEDTKWLSKLRKKRKV